MVRRDVVKTLDTRSGARNLEYDAGKVVSDGSRIMRVYVCNNGFQVRLDSVVFSFLPSVAFRTPWLTRHLPLDPHTGPLTHWVNAV